MHANGKKENENTSYLPPVSILLGLKSFSPSGLLVHALMCPPSTILSL